MPGLATLVHPRAAGKSAVGTHYSFHHFLLVVSVAPVSVEPVSVGTCICGNLSLLQRAVSICNDLPCIPASCDEQPVSAFKQSVDLQVPVHALNATAIDTTAAPATCMVCIAKC